MTDKPSQPKPRINLLGESCLRFLSRNGRLVAYLAVIASVLVTYRFVLGPGTVSIGDFVPPSLWKVHTVGLSPFDSTFLGGSYNLDQSLAPLYIGLSPFVELFGSEATYHGLLLLAPCIAGFAAIELVRALNSRPLIAALEWAVVGVFYSSNPWYVSIVVLSGHLTSIGMAYAFTPLLLLLLAFSVQTRSLIVILLAALLMAAIFDFAYYWILFIAPILLTIPLVRAKRAGGRLGVRSFAIGLGIIVATVALAISLDLYWTLPFVDLLHSGANLQLNALNYGTIELVSQNSNIAQTLRLTSYWGTPFSQGIYLQTSSSLSAIYEIASYGVAVLGLFPLLFRKHFEWKDERLWLALLLPVPLILLLAGGSQILGPLYYSLALSIPVLDNPTIFLASLAVIYSFTIPLGFRALYSKCSKTPASDPEPRTPGPSVRRRWSSLPRISRGRRAFQLLTALAIAGLLISFWPNWSGDFNGAYGTIDPPAAYSAAFDWLQEHSNGYRTLWLPAAGAYANYTWSQRYGYGEFADPVRYSTQSPVLDPPFGGLQDEATSSYILTIQQMLYANSTTSVGNLLEAGAVAYVAVRTDYLPVAYSDAVLNGTEHQADLRLVWSEGPVYIFQNLRSLSFAYVSSSLSIVYGGFDELNALPWYGIDPSTSAIVFSEDLNSSDIQHLMGSGGTHLFVPAEDYVDLEQSMTNPSSQLTAEEFASSCDWSYDLYAGSNYLDILPSGGLITDSQTSCSFNLDIGATGEYFLFEELLGGSDRYNFSLDGTPAAALATTYPGQGFVWSVYAVNLTAGTHVVSIAPAGPGPHGFAVSSLVTLGQVDNVMTYLSQAGVASRIVTTIPIFAQSPSGNSSLQPYYTSGTATPEPLVVGFGSGVGGLAGNLGQTYVTAGNYSVYLLAESSSQVPSGGSLRVYSFSQQNGSWVGGNFSSVNVTSPEFEWVRTSVSVRSGAVRIQLGGQNATVAAVALIPPSIALNLSSTGDAQAVLPLPGVHYEFSYVPQTGEVSGTYGCQGTCYLTVLEALGSLWEGTVNGGPIALQAQDGFDIGADPLPVSPSNSSMHLEITFAPVQLTEIGALVSEISLSVVAASVVFLLLWPAGNRRRPLRGRDQKSLDLDCNR